MSSLNYLNLKVLGRYLTHPIGFQLRSGSPEETPWFLYKVGKGLILIEMSYKPGNRESHTSGTESKSEE